jgi:hypothetical protein
VVPRFFGDVHAMTERGYWGQLAYPSAFPYLLSLYVGPWTVLLALRGARGAPRLVVLSVLGLLLCLGPHGPLGPVLAVAFRQFRGPVKLALLATLGLALLAGRGLERAVAARQRASPLFVLPGLALALLGFGLGRWPERGASALARLVPALGDARAQRVVAEQWPSAFTTSGALGAGVGLGLAAGPALAPVAGLLAGLDLLVFNTTLNPTTAPSFYAARPELASLLAQAEPRGPERWFSFGATHAATLGWSPEVLRRNSRAWYFYMNTQWLLPRTHVLRGLDAAFDIERAGWEPPGATLPLAERQPAHYAELHRWLRLANVRWVLAGAELPAALVEERGRAAFPEIAEPLRLYELRDPLPRVLWVPRAEAVPDAAAALQRMFRDDFDPRQLAVLIGEPAAVAAAGAQRQESGGGQVSIRASDLHTRELRITGPPGWVVLLEGFHPDWRASGAAGPIALWPANGRYLALATEAGEQTVTLRFAPRWRAVSLALGTLGVAWALALARPNGSLDRSERGALASPD